MAETATTSTETLQDVSVTGTPIPGADTQAVITSGGSLQEVVPSSGGDSGTIDWSALENIPSTVAGLPSALGANGQVLKIDANGDIVWAADANTTYSVMADAEMMTGTATAARTINAATFPAVLGAALARNSAIAALTSESPLEDVIAALQAG